MSRAASIPDSISRSSISGESVAGPIVQTIFALRMVESFSLAVFFNILLGEIEAQRECSSISSRIGCRIEYEAITAVPEDVIMSVVRGTRAARRIWRIGMHVIRQRIVEVQLRREANTPLPHGRGANFKMNVHGSSRIPARIDGGKPCLAS